MKPDHIRALEEIKAQYPQKDINIYKGGANDFVPGFCSSLGKGDRAVLLLDPYSTQLNWSTLGHVAKSEKVDLWLLFPISALLRMTPREGIRVQESWRETLNRLLGTTEWEKALYKPKELPPMDDMFGNANKNKEMERLNTDELQNWVTSCLRKLFPYVGKPFPLRSRGSLLFLFYFAVSNPSKAAWSLADKAASHIIKKRAGRS